MGEAPTPCLLGPTGSGKSDVAIGLAAATNGEVISCDAFGVYRGMSILAAAPETGDSGVPHHFVGALDPAEAWSAAAFADASDRTIAAVRARGGVPWIVGGTALYLRGWLKGFGASVPRAPDFRERLRRVAKRRGPGRLHAWLAREDPPRAAEVHPNDVRRVIRALEIIRTTGRPASELRREWEGPDRRPARLWGLRRDPEDLHDRIRRRTRAMFEAGVVEEARALLARPLSPEAAKVLGLDELGRLLDGEIDRAEAEEEIARRTRRFARKQLTFFASFAGVRWVDVARDESPESVVERVLAELPDQVRGTSA